MRAVVPFHAMDQGICDRLCGLVWALHDHPDDLDAEQHELLDRIIASELDGDW